MKAQAIADMQDFLINPSHALIRGILCRARQLNRNSPLTAIQLTVVIEVHPRYRAHKNGDRWQSVCKDQLAAQLVVIFEETHRTALVILVRS